jgi:small subunit ribosomal protein S3e
MKGWDPEGHTGPRKPLPDSVQIYEPPVDKIVSEPSSEQRDPVAAVAPPPPVAEEAYQQPPQEGGFQEGEFGESAAPF